MSAEPIAVIGSVAFDTLETPSGRADDELGGSATHFAVAASFFAPVRLVAPVGDDFPQAARDYLVGRGIDCSGLERRPGRTFRWHGRYHEDMNKRDTLHLDLGVFAGFAPDVAAEIRRSRTSSSATSTRRYNAACSSSLQRPASSASTR